MKVRSVSVAFAFVLTFLGSANSANASATSTTTGDPACAPAPVVQAVFVGKVVSIDEGVVRYAITQIRAGSLSGYAVENQVDVYYDDDAVFLEEGKEYIVGANPDQITNRLSSKVQEGTPLFGGAEVAGLDGSGVVCPKYEDPIRTLNVNGSYVESGVFTGFFNAKGRIFGSLALSVGLVFGGLFVIVIFKRSVDGASRASARKKARQQSQHSRSRVSQPPQRPSRPRA